MPKAYRHRSHHSVSRSRYFKAPFPMLYIALTCIIGSYLFVWTLHRVAFSADAYSVVGQPSISVDLINHVLQRNHSPAIGKGQALYDYGIKYNIDPAYALAFFMHESSFGTRGVATITHSLGNIRATPGYQQYDGYRRYRTWEEGFEDWYRLIANLYVSQWGLSTIDQIIPIYAPASDNNDEYAYIQAIKTAVDTWHKGQ